MARSLPRLCTSAALAISLFASLPARADDARTAAQSIFDEAMKLMAERAYDRACPKLEDVVKILPGKVGARMELARCYEEWGKIASAWSRYRAAADAAAALEDPREAKARAKVDALAARLPKLTIAVAPANRATPGFSVQRDGRALAASEWDAELPLDPDKHVVIASAPGKKTWTGNIDIAAGAPPARLEIPVLEDESPPPAPPSRATPDSTPRDAIPALPPAPASGGTPAWAWAAGAVGVVALGVGVGFGVDGLSAKGSLDTLCKGSISPCAGHGASEVDPLNARKNRGLGMFIGFGAAGVAGIAAGVIGLVQSRSPAPRAARALVVVPWAGPGLSGVALESTF